MRSLILVALALIAGGVGARAEETRWRDIPMHRATRGADIDLVRSVMLRAETEVEAFAVTGLVIHRHAWIGFVDLDDDGEDEAIVLIENKAYCEGKDCWALVLRRENDHWAYMCGGPLDASRGGMAIADRVQSNGRRVFRTPHVIAWIDTGQGIVCYTQRDLRARGQVPPPSTHKPFLKR